MIGQGPGSVMSSSLAAAEKRPPSADAQRVGAEGEGGIRVSRSDPAEVFEPGKRLCRRASVDSKGSIVIPGGTGSQGIALAYAASKTFESHGRRILIPVRDQERASALQIEIDGKSSYKLVDLPGVSLVAQGQLKDADASRMIIITTVPPSALADVLSTLPKKPEALIATYNGVPPNLPQGLCEPEHVVSMIPSFGVPQKASTFAFRPGALIVSKSSPVAKDLASIFGTTFAVQEVDSGRHAQWTKIATNTAANSLATLLGIKVMDLRKRIDSDESVQKLLKGIVAETCMVAGREGVNFSLDALYQQVLAKIPPTMDHFTSTGATFRAGGSLKEDIAALSGGVSTAGSRDLGPGKPVVQTPICNALAGSLRNLERERGQGPMPADFYERDAVKHIQASLLSPELLGDADAAVERARSLEAASVGGGAGAPGDRGGADKPTDP